MKSSPWSGVILSGALALLGATGDRLAAADSPGRQLWVYCPRNLLVEAQVAELEQLFTRAARAGYTHVLLADSKFARLGDMDERYFRHLERVKRAAASNALEIVPALFPVGYSNDLLFHDPNLIEGLPVRGALFVVRDGVARLAADPAVPLKGGDFGDLQLWDWKDDTVSADAGAALIRDPRGRNARIVQQLRVSPFRQYHLSLRVKTEGFRGTLEAKFLADGRPLNFNPLGVQATQEWTTHHVTFNSLEHTNVSLYLGCWGGESGAAWFDDVRLEEVGLLNLIRRAGAPLEIRREDGGALVEGRDFEPLVDPKMGRHPWPGEYDVWHEPPVIKTGLPDGTRLRVSYYHAVTIYQGQAMICPSEPRTIELLRDQARRMHAAWQAGAYFMSHDEIRVLNRCAACAQRQLSAGTLLADHVRTCLAILKETAPTARVYVWSDMFDPHHNAVANYYLVRGDLTGAWEGLDPSVVIVPWYFEKRAESLQWFAGRGHRQMIAGYYDAAPERVREWLSAAQAVDGVEGVMYTTWENRYDDLERFATAVRSFHASSPRR
ncbi:MAG: hypothetical protein IPM17_01765 [Verrucomicrobia bacterium]|nr:hypothetical protein [Verrucomicrobiota bacterium]